MRRNTKPNSHLRNAVIFLGLAFGAILATAFYSARQVTQQFNPPLPTETIPPSPTANLNLVTAESPPDNITETAIPEPANIILTPTVIGNPSPTPITFLVNENGDYIPITWGDYPGPTTWPSVMIPPPIGILPKPDGQINILLLGNDYRKKHGTRTDTIMLLSLNPNQGTASITSFPRDLFVYAPGWTMLKINTVQPRGGYELLFDTMEYNFGVRPDYYVNVNRDAFVEIVDSMGGLEVYVPHALNDPSFAGGKFSVEPGWVHMDGSMARWYVSSRTTSNDFARNNRQQEVLRAIFIQLLSMGGLTRAPDIYNTYRSEVVTDLTLDHLIPLIPLATQLSDTSRVHRFAVEQSHVTQTRLETSGAYVLIPNQLEVLKLMLEVLTP